MDRPWMDRLRENPSASLDVECRTPSGKTVQATIGPIINGVIAAHAEIRGGPPTEEDIDFVKALMSQLVGRKPYTEVVTKTRQEERSAQLTKMRMMGGGLG